MKVRTTRNPWDWWFEVGTVYEVAKCPYKVTSSNQTDECDCVDCKARREGEQLYEAYEVTSEQHKGCIIPVIFTKPA